MCSTSFEASGVELVRLPSHSSSIRVATRAGFGLFAAMA
jgi:hypothetical protein